MATVNPFDLLSYDDNEDPSLLIAALQKVAPPLKKASAPVLPAKLPSKPLPPAEAVRGARNEASRGGGRGFGRRGGREGGFNREPINNGNSSNENIVAPGGYIRHSEDENGGRTFERRGGYRGPRADRGGYGGRRGDFNSGDAPEGEMPRRTYDRRSGTGQGNEVKRDGGGRGNWGTQTDEIVQEVQDPVNENEKTVETEKQAAEQEVSADAKKENPEKESEEKEPEVKEMTLEEYEKILEEKRKSLHSSKGEERKVSIDKEFESMQLLSSKKTDAEIFVKLGSEKDKRKDSSTEKEEKTKKSVSINEFLKPAEGEAYYGRGRGRGGRGRGGGGSRYNVGSSAAAPSINEANFPSLGGK